MGPPEPFFAYIAYSAYTIATALESSKTKFQKVSIKNLIPASKNYWAVHKWRHCFGGGGGLRFVTCLTISGRFLRKKRDIGGGGVKKSIFAVTLFMDDPYGKVTKNWDQI